MGMPVANILELEQETLYVLPTGFVRIQFCEEPA